MVRGVSTEVCANPHRDPMLIVTARTPAAERRIACGSPRRADRAGLGFDAARLRRSRGVRAAGRRRRVRGERRQRSGRHGLRRRRGRNGRRAIRTPLPATGGDDRGPTELVPRLRKRNPVARGWFSRAGADLGVHRWLRRRWRPAHDRRSPGAARRDPGRHRLFRPLGRPVRARSRRLRQPRDPVARRSRSQRSRDDSGGDAGQLSDRRC